MKILPLRWYKNCMSKDNENQLHDNLMEEFLGEDVNSDSDSDEKDSEKEKDAK